MSDDFKDISNEIDASTLRPDEIGKFHYCYLIRALEDGPHCIETGNPMKYFGVRSSDAIPHHDTKYYGSGKRITQDIRQFGKYNFEKLILSVHASREEAMEYEEYFMDQHQCVDKTDFYNLSWKSTGGAFSYHKDLRDGTAASPQLKNGKQKDEDVMTVAERAKQAAEELEKKKAEIKEAKSNATSVSKAQKELLALKEKQQRELDEKLAELQKQEEEERIAAEKAKEEAERLAKEKREAEKEERRSNQQVGTNYDGNPDGRTNHSGQMGGKRPGAGRPKGAKNIATKASVKKLEEHGYDPIEAMLETRATILADMNSTRSISTRSSYTSQLIKIDEVLMKYGYRPVPTREEKSVEVEKKGPMSIVLTGNDSDKKKENKEETKH